MLNRLAPTIAAISFAGLFACSSAESPQAEDEAAASATARYIIELKDFERGKAQLKAHGKKIAVEAAESKIVAAHLTKADAEEMARDANVADIELDVERYPMAQSTPFGISMVQATDSAFASGQSRNRLVCIIDSGLYTGHEDLSGVPASGGNTGLTWNQDGCGHGTHVAGTIAALDNSVGVIGVAPRQVSLFIVRVFGDDCTWAYASDLIAALNQCTAAGANVVSMSLGGSGHSRAEERAFQNAYNAGVLSIAAAGNGGTTVGTADPLEYPAGYSSVVSVAAIDSAQALADFSQENSDVELAAPGVDVMSTVPFTSVNTVTAGSNTYSGTHVEGAAFATVSGNFADGGLCTSAGSWAGRVVMCQRGTISFLDKVNNVIAGGGIAAVIYNNVPGGLSATLGDGVTSTLPAIGISQADGQAIVAANIGQSGTVVTTAPTVGSGYEAWSGTSMATPHVSGVAALVWSQHTTWSNVQIRNALDATALDLGTAGRDISFGFGVVQAKRALDFLNAGGCQSVETSCNDGIDNDCDGARDNADSDCVTCFPVNHSCTTNSQCCSSSCRPNHRCR